LSIVVTVIYENGEGWNMQLTMLFDEHTAIILRVEMITDERLVLLEVVSTGKTMWTIGLILLRLEKQGA